jgi:hypothetical protein
MMRRIIRAPAFAHHPWQRKRAQKKQEEPIERNHH